MKTVARRKSAPNKAVPVELTLLQRMVAVLDDFLDEDVTAIPSGPVERLRRQCQRALVEAEIRGAVDRAVAPLNNALAEAEERAFESFIAWDRERKARAASSAAAPSAGPPPGNDNGQARRSWPADVKLLAGEHPAVMGDDHAQNGAA